jgi:SAM-dependent methyltransferase
MCGGNFAAVHQAREMMLGTRESFRYGECGQCGTLQLLDVPDDLSRYYPENYYSLQPKPRAGWVIRAAKRARAEAAIRGHDRVARLIGRGAAAPQWPLWLRHAGVDRSAAICDLGCGNGDMLLDLKDQGFTRLTGADAFIPKSTVREGIEIHKATPREVPGSFDLVMLNHSFEHMPDPVGTMEALQRLVRPRGTLMIRLPVAGCAAWRQYGVDWVSLDAPRHLFVPTERALRDLAEQTGFQVTSVVYDSSAMQFWRSEQYRADVPLFADRSHEVNPRESAFSPAHIADWERQAAELNAAGDGDTAAFFLRHQR